MKKLLFSVVGYAVLLFISLFVKAMNTLVTPAIDALRGFSWNSTLSAVFSSVQIDAVKTMFGLANYWIPVVPALYAIFAYWAFVAFFAAVKIVIKLIPTVG